MNKLTSEEIILFIKKRAEANRDREAEIFTHNGNQQTANVCGLYASAFEELLHDLSKLEEVKS